MVEKSKGQAAVERVAGWLSGLMSFKDSGISLVLALWAFHTWFSERMDATPYLAITAATKQSGKTRLMELLQMICRGGKLFGDMTPSALFQTIEAYDCKCTIFFDEAEKLSSAAAGVMRSVMNTGYRQGQTVTRSRAGGSGVNEFRVFGPKCFALIGDVNDTLRDRSIVVTLERGKPSRDNVDRSSLRGEAVSLVEDIRSAFERLPSASAQPWMTGRDREIWAALFGIAEALKLDKGTMEVLTRTAADLVGAKSAPARRFEAVEDEAKAADAVFAERAIGDLRRVLREGEPAIFSAVAVDRLLELADGPWRTFKGVGLTVDSLALLVSRFGLGPVDCRMVRGAGAKKAAVRKGYTAKSIAAVAL